MSVLDHGLDAIRKSTVPYPLPSDLTNKSEYQLRTTGTAKLSGLSDRMRTTTMMVGDTAVLLPSAPISGRNHIEVHNLSENYTLYVGISNLITADDAIGETAGKEIPPRSYWNIDITDAIELYGITVTAQSIKVKVTEVA